MTKQIKKPEAIVTENFYPGRDRYYYDFIKCTPAKGWQQFPSIKDSTYFGVWVNSKTRQILIFAEGNELLVTASTLGAFNVKLEQLGTLYGSRPTTCVDPAPTAYTVIDPNGLVTKHVNGRADNL